MRAQSRAMATLFRLSMEMCAGASLPLSLRRPAWLLPQPKWAASSKGPRTSTQQLIHQLRAEVWGRGLGIDNFSGFASNLPATAKPKKCFFPIASAVCYANG